MRRIVNGLVSGCIAISLAFPAGLMAQAPAGQPAETAAAPAATQGEKSFSQEELDQLLAPVALYPDPLLAQVLMASTYPLEVVEAARWSKANPNVKDQALEDAMQQQSWDPSVKSLTAFPQVLTMMNEKLDWTQKLGDAFLAQQEDVMGTVQNLRAKAQQQGNLQDTPEQKVIVEKEKETIIRIEPADPQVIYVPTYNPTVVYGTWWYPAYPPYYYYPPGYVATGIFWFSVGIAVGSALWGGCNWRGGYVNINVNRYNSFNRTRITNNTWNHNVNHRRGVAYRDQRVAQQYNRGINREAARNREQFRGRAELGRQDLGQQFDRGQVRDRSRERAGDRGPGGAVGDRGTRDLGAADRGTRDLGGADRSRELARPGGGDRDMGPGRRDMSRGGGTPGGGSRDYSGTRRSSGFDGAGQGRQARDYSNRGQASRQSMGGSRGGGGARGGGGRGGGRR